MEPTDHTRRFLTIVQGSEDEIRLDETALLIAAHADPGLRLTRELGRLDDLAEGCFAPTLDALARYLLVDMGFRGDRENYYDPVNSYLNEVLDRRRGIPISLSVLMIEVGRRIGVPIGGVGLPGHFLLRDRVDRAVFLDPFNGGAVLRREHCIELFHGMHGADATFDEAWLEPIGPRVILGRMLANLQSIFHRNGDLDSLLWAQELGCALPEAPLSVREGWAQTLVSLGRFTEAANVLEAAADRLPSDRAEAWRSTAVGLRARLN